MIICFSGTGNSRRIADQLQDALGDELVRFPPGLMREPECVKIEVFDERVIWVFPVHSWGLPSIVEDVLKKSVIYGRQPLVHYMVVTCGDDIGYTDRLWRKAVKSRGWIAASAFSVQMPNSYTFFKGFDVDPPALAEAKLIAAEGRTEEIARMIDQGDHSIVDVVPGKWPWFKTYIIRPWFNRFMTKTTPFHATDACASCGRCARNCPMNIIDMVDGKPRWNGEHCVMCSRCYNCCPTQAVQYGRVTRGKGQYVCPGFSLNK